jgi:hypothetical protein
MRHAILLRTLGPGRQTRSQQRDPHSNLRSRPQHSPRFATLTLPEDILFLDGRAAAAPSAQLATCAKYKTAWRLPILVLLAIMIMNQSTVWF